MQPYSIKRSFDIIDNHKAPFLLFERSHPPGVLSADVTSRQPADWMSYLYLHPLFPTEMWYTDWH